MPYYAVANGRRTGVYDNWEDCKDQVDGYSRNHYKKFDTPDEAWDFVDQHSSRGNTVATKSRAVACQNNQIARRCHGEVSGYQSTDYMDGKNSTVVRERSCISGRDGYGYFVEKRTRTYWKNK